MDPNTEVVTPEVPEDETPEAAILRGAADATEQPAEAVEPTAPQAGEEVAEVVKTPEELAAEAATKTPEEVAAEAAKVEPEAPKPDPDTEKEVADLNLKGRTADRFRELSGEVKAAAPVMEAIKAANIPIEQLPSALKAASDHREWVQQVVDTGASPEDYADSLHLLSLVSRAREGDNASAEAALQALAPIVADIARLTGREVPGLFNPIDAHPDLKDAVEVGDMTHKAALEVVRARQLTANTQQQNTQRQQAYAQSQAAQQGVNDLIAIDAEFKASDADYARKRPILNGIVQTIRETLPPGQWATATRKAYAAIQLPAAAPAPVVRATPPVGHVPLRPTGSRANLQPDFDDPMAAMMAGIQAARG